MNESTPHHPSDHSRAGVCPEDVERLDRALAGVIYPAPKWQLLAHADRESAGPALRNLRAVELLWALPNDDYRDRAQVLAAAARTARGHPRRPSRDPILGRTIPTPRRHHEGDPSALSPGT